MPSWQNIQPNGTRCREETRLIFWMVKACGGRWFAQYESDMSTSVKLKHAAMKARGQTGGLITFEEWFKKAQALKRVSIVT